MRSDSTSSQLSSAPHEQFLNRYSTSSIAEDKAEIWASLMCYQQVLKSPALQAKITAANPSRSVRRHAKMEGMFAAFFINHRIEPALAQAVAAGFGGSLTDDVVVAGHSLGSQCAANLALASVQAGAPYAAAVVMGGYVPGSDVAAFPLPVLSLNAELDGGYARPGFISLSLRSSDAWTSEQAQPLDGQWQLSRGPVVILPGLDHSSFCPGYSVPGDVFPAEATEEASDGLIGANVAAFLHLQTDQPTSVEDAAGSAGTRRTPRARPAPSWPATSAPSCRNNPPTSSCSAASRPSKP